MANKLLLFFILCLEIGISFCGDNCARSQSLGPFQLNETHYHKMEYSKHNTMGDLYRIPVNVRSTILMREVYLNYGYVGANYDPQVFNTKEVKFVIPDEAEAREWVKRKQCKIGEICGIKGTCWGNDWIKCKQATPNHWVSSRDFHFLNEKYHYYLYHTCNMDWSCKMHETVFPLEFNHAGEVVITLKDGTKRVIENGKSSIYLKEEEYGILMDIDWSNTGPFSVNMLCVDANKQDHYCNVIKCPLEEAQGVVLRNGYSRHYYTERRASDDSDKKSLSDLNDLLEAQNQLEFLILETMHNLLLLQTNVDNFYNAWVKTVISLSKIDDSLISTLTKGNFKTKWLNENKFHIFPCEKHDIPGDSNCGNKYAYEDGRIQHRKDNIICQTYPDSVVKKIDLVEGVDLDFGVVRIPEVIGSYLDYEGWTWVASQRKKITDSMELSEKIGDPDSGLSFVAGLSALAGNWSYVASLLSSPWCLINSLLILMLILKR
nr:MAG: hemagglutinin [Cheilodipterus quinquelineatus orthomyxovirus]